MSKKKIRIGVISRVQSDTIDLALKKEAEKRGHTYTKIVFSTEDVTDAENILTQAGLLEYDVLYYRTSLGYVWAQVIEAYLSKHKKEALNLQYITHAFLEKKTYQTATVSRENVLTPKTVLDTSNDFKTIASKLGSPFVVKADVSSQGRDVHLVHSEKEFMTTSSKSLRKPCFYQEYIPHEYDCRVHLVGGKPVASYRRVPNSGEFRSNVSLGGRMEALSNEDKNALYPLAEQVAKILNLDLHVVDFMRSKITGKYYFTEVNSNPGWNKWNPNATGVNMNSLVMDYFEAYARG